MTPDKKEMNRQLRDATDIDDIKSLILLKAYLELCEIDETTPEQTPEESNLAGYKNPFEVCSIDVVDINGIYSLGINVTDELFDLAKEHGKDAIQAVIDAVKGGVDLSRAIEIAIAPSVTGNDIIEYDKEIKPKTNTASKIRL